MLEMMWIYEYQRSCCINLSVLKNMAYTQYLKQLAMTLCLFTFAIRENNNQKLIPFTRYHQGNGSREQEPDGPAGKEHGQAPELRPDHGGGRGDGTPGDGAETQEGAGGEGDH